MSHPTIARARAVARGVAVLAAAALGFGAASPTIAAIRLAPTATASQARALTPSEQVDRYDASPPLRPFESASAFMAPNIPRGEELIYVNNDHSIAVYTANGKMVGQIPAPSGTAFLNTEMAVDREGNLWANATESDDTRVVLRFKHGDTKPDRTLVLGQGAGVFGQGLVVTHDGTVYAARPLAGDIAVFAPGATSPTLFLPVPPNDPGPFDLTLSPVGNVLALIPGALMNHGVNGTIVEYRPGDTTPRPLPYNVLGSAYTFGIAADPSTRIVVSIPLGNNPSVDVFLRHDFHGYLTDPPNVFFFKINAAGTRLYAVTNTGAVQTYSWPALQPLGTLQSSGAYSAAVSPAANV